MSREDLGRLVRETWCAWAREQPLGERKLSWLIPWTELDAGQREVDMRIGEAIAAAERERCAQLAEQHGAHYGCYVSIEGSQGAVVTSGLRPFAALLQQPPW